MNVLIPVPYCPELNARQRNLLRACIIAHQKAARDNPNASSVTMKNAAVGGGSIPGAIAAACLTIGAMHAPVYEARGLYVAGNKEVVLTYLAGGKKIAGFGNSFFKDGIDPAFAPVLEMLAEEYPDAWNRINVLCQWMIEGGRQLYPNAALITGAVLEICGWKVGTEQSFFILARLPIWVDMVTGGGDGGEPEPIPEPVTPKAELQPA